MQSEKLRRVEWIRRDLEDIKAQIFDLEDKLKNLEWEKAQLVEKYHEAMKEAEGKQ